MIEFKVTNTSLTGMTLTDISNECKWLESPQWLTIATDIPITDITGISHWQQNDIMITNITVTAVTVTNISMLTNISLTDNSDWYPHHDITATDTKMTDLIRQDIIMTSYWLTWQWLTRKDKHHCDIILTDMKLTGVTVTEIIVADISVSGIPMTDILLTLQWLTWHLQEFHSDRHHFDRQQNDWYEYDNTVTYITVTDHFSVTSVKNITVNDENFTVGHHHDIPVTVSTLERLTWQCKTSNWDHRNPHHRDSASQFRRTDTTVTNKYI